MSATVGLPHDRPGSLLTHPLMVGCLVLLVLNDHVLKPQFHNALTGKVSDVVGLALFPVLVTALVEVGCWALRRQRPDRLVVLVVAGVATAICFAAIQLVPSATELYRLVAGLPWSGQSSVTADATDLLALPAVAAGWLLTRFQESPS